MAVAEASDIVFVAAEGGFGGFLVAVVAGEFKFERTELLVDYLPDNFVGGHAGRREVEEEWQGCSVHSCGISLMFKKKFELFPGYSVSKMTVCHKSLSFGDGHLTSPFLQTFGSQWMELEPRSCSSKRYDSSKDK